LHDLRRSFALLLMNNGRTKITERYARLQQETREEGANAAPLATRGARRDAA
jgi:hypothetical protein